MVNAHVIKEPEIVDQRRREYMSPLRIANVVVRVAIGCGVRPTERVDGIVIRFVVGVNVTKCETVLCSKDMIKASEIELAVISRDVVGTQVVCSGDVLRSAVGH